VRVVEKLVDEKEGVTEEAHRVAPARVLAVVADSAMQVVVGRATALVVDPAKAVVRALGPGAADPSVDRLAVLHVGQGAVLARIEGLVATTMGRAGERISATVRARAAFRALRVSAKSGPIAPMQSAMLVDHAAKRRDVVPTHRRLDRSDRGGHVQREE
jgi:hypothetical protein